MLKTSFLAFVVSAFGCAMLSAQEPALNNQINQPRLRPQNSGTTNGLIAVWPVNTQVVWACGRNGTFTVTTDGGHTWHAHVVPGAETLQSSKLALSWNFRTGKVGQLLREASSLLIK